MRVPGFFIFCVLLLFSAKPVSSQVRFVENDRQWFENVLYRTEIPGGMFYLERGRFTIDLHDAETVGRVFAAHSGAEQAMDPPKKLNCHAYYLNFEGANPHPTVSGGRATDARYHFFIGDDPGRWASDVRAFEEVRYRELYTGIDLKVYSNGPIKYDFIIKPHADASQIRLSYEGVKPKRTDEGQLLLKTSVGEVFESRPFAYQLVDGHITPIDCQYRVSGKEVTFEIGAYDPSLDLIIDPELIFSTYSGSTADNFGYTATFDEEGHLYAGSSVFGTGYPTTPGAYQATWAGGVGAGALAGTDIALTKFNLQGTGLVYSTYLGGAGDELPHSLITDEDGGLYLLGTTGSANFPVSDGAFQTDFAGGAPTVLGGVGINYNAGADMVVTRLSPAGNALVGSTYVGGSENDGVNTAAALRYNYADEVRGEIELDPDGNVVVGSTTFSEDFPVTAGAYQSVKNGGQDGVVFVMNPTLSAMIASTYYGGNGNDAIYSIDTFDGTSIMVGGGTTSADLSTAGTPFQANNAGGSADGFLAAFDPNLASLEAMTYYGSTAYDQVYFVERDEVGRPHIFGQTEATGTTFVDNALYSVPNSGMLLSKFSPDLDERIWSTVFGNGTNIPNLSPSAFSVDICNRIYLSGWGGNVNNQGSTNGLPVTDDALQSTTDGSDFYFLVLDGDANELTFASFFGGGTSAEHVDGGTSRFDRSGKIYQAVCAGCGSNDDFPIAPSNAHSPTNNSFNCNLGVAKIDFDLPLVVADFTAEPVCAPDPVTFVNTSTTGSPETVFFWDFGDGASSNQANPTHTYAAPGVYEATLVVWDPLACNLSDTLSIDVVVAPGVALNLEPVVASCTDTIFTIEAASGGTATSYLWATDPGFANVIAQGPNDSIIDFATSTPAILYVEATNGPCSATGSIQVIPAPQAALTVGDTLICQAGEIPVSLLTSPGQDFLNFTWEPEDLLVEGQGSPAAVFEANATFLLIASAESEYGCFVSDTAEVRIFPLELEAPENILVCTDDPVTLTANSLGTAEAFVWADNPSLSPPLNGGPQDSTIVIQPSAFAYYYIQVTNGDCARQDSVGVSLFQAGTTLSPDRYICAGDTVQIVVTNDFPGTVLAHAWEPEELILSGQGTSTVIVSVVEPTTFTVLSSTEGADCVVENQMTLFTSPLGEMTVAAAADPTIIALGGSSNLAVVPADGAYVYQWEPSGSLDNAGVTNPIATPDETTTYTVNIVDVDSLGACVKSSEVTVTVVEAVCGDPFIYVPNAFTPNGDGENDLLFVRGTNIASLKFFVYDRWGELVFETDDQSRGWDGTHKGRMAGPAVFVYHLEVDCGDGQTFSTQGNVTLIR